MDWLSGIQNALKITLSGGNMMDYKIIKKAPFALLNIIILLPDKASFFYK